jgi:hypothetical protein
MAVVREDLPPGRYGQSADARADRRLRTVGAVLGLLALAALGWFGYHYVAGQSVSGEVIKFKIVSASSVEVHLEVHKDRGSTGTCTLRALAVDHSEVGRKDVHFAPSATRIDQIVTLRTTAKATGTELVGCSSGG